MKQLLYLFLFIQVYSSMAANPQNQFILHPVPKDILYSYHNDDFTVCVRLRGEEWHDLYEYKVMVDVDKPQTASMVQFDFSGEVEMRVKVNNGRVHEVKIRPLVRNINFVVEDNCISFFLQEPAKLSLEVNGDRLHNLHIFANPIETEKPNPDSPDVIYFGEGVHAPKDSPSNSFNISSNKTVYLAPGAIIKGKFICDKVENVRFIGRGIIDNPERGFEIKFSKNIEIDGITVVNPTHYTVYGGQTDHLKIRNLKSFSCKGWSDGIDLMGCSNVDIQDIFLRNSDDCIAIYTHRWDFYGDAKNYIIKNAVLWADIAHPINIGLHGNTKTESNTIENLYFSDVDILEHDEDDRNYQGCLAFSVSDYNLVKDVTFENIRIENIQEGQLFNLRVLYNEKYSSGPGRGIENVVFRNIDYTGCFENPSVIEGYDADRQVSDVSFENIVINGKRAGTLSEAGINVGKYTNNITIK